MSSVCVFAEEAEEAPVVIQEEPDTDISEAETDTPEETEDALGIAAEETEEETDEALGIAAEEEKKQEAAADTKSQEKAKRTILLYDCGSNLETEAGLASYNLRQILKSSFSEDDDIRFIVMTGGSYQWQLEKEYLVFPDEVNVPEDAGLIRNPHDPDQEKMLGNKDVISGVYNQIWEAKGIDAAENPGKMVLLDGDGLTGEGIRSEDELMGDAKTLQAFINYAAENYPAEKYDLILWDHGGGPTGGFGDDENYAFASDWNAQDSMSFAGIVDALAHNKVTDADSDGTLDGRFDFVDFDACLMNSVELALIMADYTDYYVASVESEPGYGQYYGPKQSADGQDYTGWLDALGEDPDYDTYELGKIIVDDFYKFYEKETGDGSTQEGTLAVVDTQKMLKSGFVDALIELSRLLTRQANDPSIEDGVLFYDEFKSFYNTIEYSGYELFDLGDVAGLLGVVNCEISDYNLDHGYFVDNNLYYDVSRQISALFQDTDSDRAFIYAQGTSGIEARENYYRSVDGRVAYGSRGTSGMSIYFPGNLWALSAVSYFKEMDPVIETLPENDKRKRFFEDYEEAVAYYSLIFYAGRTVDNLLNDEEDQIEIVNKQDVNYDLVMYYWKDYVETWDDFVVPVLEKIDRDESEIEEWYRTIIAQQVEDAAFGDYITVERDSDDDEAGCTITIDNARKRVINSAERNLYAELPAYEEYKKTLSPDEIRILEYNGQLQIGSIKGTLAEQPEEHSVEERIKWYNESGMVWEIAPMEQKWYAITDADGTSHVVSFYNDYPDAFIVPVLAETAEDIPDEERMYFLEFSRRETDGDQHELTGIYFVDSDKGPVETELKTLKNGMTLMPILWVQQLWGPSYYIPISLSPFVLSADNAGSISLVFTDVENIEDIADVTGDGKPLTSTFTVTDLYNDPITVSDRMSIGLSRVRPAFYTGEELVPEVVFLGETLENETDYMWKKTSHYDWDTGKMVYPEFIEPGDYSVDLYGRGNFGGYVSGAIFTIVQDEDDVLALIERAETNLANAQDLMQRANDYGTEKSVERAKIRLANAQDALAEAQDMLKQMISYNCVEGKGLTWTKGSKDPAVFTFKRTENDDKTFSLFRGILVDGKATDAYTAEAGSVIITVTPEYLTTLSSGEHTFQALFADGESEKVTFNIQEAGKKDDPGKKDVPDKVNTGDQNQIWIWAALLLMAMLIAVLSVVIYRSSKKKQNR